VEISLILIFRNYIVGHVLLDFRMRNRCEIRELSIEFLRFRIEFVEL